ncbi:AMP-binding protein [Alicyclobacillus cycloheptanicus]|uniref:Long-chain acyl-CoA synthetase n=1 Tax=Alicyclobacillus cycloheptanicus TaxID=1457 RepID=A0ABT9XIS8_9BACL|nr:AMP-binding protein [Alicyclobacillus cycloheptanicus]MDQ0189616.1 long-chain acyl-CoA synthetase [Alicyclobacillus cycloheptanicus]WDL99925.1 AMP-binding protein [Alicyclobacillus cycloheptanicus]
MNLVELLYTSVTKFDNKEAMRYKQNGQWRTISYRQLWDYITQLAAGLYASGVKSGDKVAILSENCPEWVITDFAVLSLGAVSVPIFATLPADQVGFILQNADVTVAVVENTEQLQKIQQVWAQPLERVILLKDRVRSGDGRISTFSDLLAIGSAPTNTAPPIDVNAVSDDQLATIVHTSGTSGLPKGVMLSHRNIVSNVHAALTVLPVEPDDVSLSYLPLSHIFERTVEEYALLSTGATVAYAEGIDNIQENLKEIRPTILVSVPRLLEKVYSGVRAKLEDAPKPIRGMVTKAIQSQKNAGLSFLAADKLVFKKLREGLGGRIRAVVSGGAGLAGEIAHFYIKAGIPVYEGYGMTEAAPVIAANPFGASRPGTVGKPIPGVEVKLAEDGELLVRGPNVMMGYYKQPEETARTLADGWLHTGDIAEILPDGYVRIVDRKKNILVLATGKNVAPFPIENAIALSPYISEAILVGDGLKYVSALIVPDFEALQPMAGELGLSGDPSTWTANPNLRRLMQQEVAKAVGKFAEFEQPKRIALIPNPLTIEGGDITPSLKVRMKVIREKYGHLIEAMYAGTDYIPVSSSEPMPAETTRPTSPAPVAAEAPEDSGHDDTGGAHPGGSTIPPGAIVPGAFDNTQPPQNAAAASDTERAQSYATETAETAVTPAKKRRKAKLLIGAVVLLIVVAGITTAASEGRLQLNPRVAKDANLNGQIAAIGDKNNQISSVNHQIVQNLQQMNNLAGITGQLGTNLKGLKANAQQQGVLLGQLQNLSGKQVNLSQQLRGLSGTLTGDLSKIDANAETENQSIQQMSQSAGQLSTLAAALVQSNQNSATKLAKAKSDADQVASEMP